MPLPDTMFCAQQIHIPPELPDILKQFTKAAIRTQPADLLQWSAGHKAYVSLLDLERKWRTLCLPVEKLRALLQLDPCEDKIEWLKFLALGCSALGGSLNTAMKHFCEILTADPEGGPARIPFDTFSYVYRYLSRLDSDVSALDTESYLATLKDSVSRKNGMVGLSDFFAPQRSTLKL
ncbi:ropporin-1-like protein isoform X2 [Fukomys damarensis]|uniref:ropporin-1-like protein isoform X2 n=1 Tax=Fukomys damarensis TaxID=885580 RepID=UPI0008FEC432|nr:ropporin-1-like protein isoform X2 [Fukomys damarensis]